MNTLDEKTFIRLATATLEHLDIAIEDAAQTAEIDIENTRRDKILEIEFNDRSKIIINLQTPMQEIWVAAKMGGFHFRYSNANHCWLDTRDKQELYQVVAQLINNYTGMLLNLKSNHHGQE